MGVARHTDRVRCRLGVRGVVLAPCLRVRRGRLLLVVVVPRLLVRGLRLRRDRCLRPGEPGTRIASTRVDASAASGAEFPGAGASDDDGDDSVSEEALLRDWRGEDDASVSASSHSQGFSESESGEGSGGSESESGEPGVVDFD